MIVVLKPNTGEEVIAKMTVKIQNMGYSVYRSNGEQRTVLGVIGQSQPGMADILGAFSSVEKVIPISKPYNLACRDLHPHNTVITFRNGMQIGGEEILVMAGPCAVEDEEQMREVAYLIKEAGTGFLRGGVFKPRTSPYSFQGLEREGLDIIKKVAEETGLLVITEVIDPINIEEVADYVDILQVGTRNMQNFILLKELGQAGKPVVLKRGMSATIEEWLMAAEYIISSGNPNVILCERGIRTFETHTRNTLDLSAIPVVKELCHLPVMVDPSHATGRRQLVPAMSKAALAAGADGLLIEVHPRPEEALSDGPQSLYPEEFKLLMLQLKEVARCVGRIMSF